MSLNISSDLVPQVVNNYNAYTGDDKMIGLAAATLTAPCRASSRAWRQR